MKSRNLRSRLALLASGLLLAGQASAHAGAAHLHSLGDGVLHPFTGWDHALAAVAVGLVAARWRALTWRVPSLFMGSMALGAIIGAVLLPAVGVEAGIAASLLAIGLLLLAPLRSRVSPLPGLALVVAAGAGLAHGLVHGAEAGMQPAYLAGVLAGTIVLHAAGITAGRSAWMSVPVLRLAGLVTAVAGAGIILAA